MENITNLEIIIGFFGLTNFITAVLLFIMLRKYLLNKKILAEAEEIQIESIDLIKKIANEVLKNFKTDGANTLHLMYLNFEENSNKLFKKIDDFEEKIINKNTEITEVLKKLDELASRNFELQQRLSNKNKQIDRLKKKLNNG